MRLHRLLGIMMLLDSRGIMNAGSLAKILETSERTIYRDMDILCEAGIPIMSISGPHGGYSFMEGYKLNTSTLQSKDAVHLLLSGMGIRPEKNTQTAHHLANALIKLENSLSMEHRAEIIRAKESFFMDQDPWWGKNIPNKYVDIIQDAILHLKKLKVCYKKYSGDFSERILSPYGAVIKSSHWYVIAFCETANDIRVFKCSRIRSIEVLKENFIIPSDFNLKTFWNKTKEALVRQISVKLTPPAYPVKLRCFQETSMLFEGFEVYSCVQLDGAWFYTVDMLSFKTACSVLFPLSDKIQVLEPTELIAYIHIKAQKILECYTLKPSY